MQLGGQASVGEKGVAIAFGKGSKAKGEYGSVIVLVETDEEGNIIGKRALLVDDEKVKSNTFYTLKNNRLCECESEDKNK